MNRVLAWFEDLDSRQRLAVTVAAPLLILFLYWVLLLGPRRQGIADMREQIAGMEEERERKTVEAAQVLNREHEVAELDRELALALSKLPDQKEIEDLLSSVSTLGMDSGLEILVFRQQPEVYQEFYAEVPVEMHVRGNYHQVAQFLDRVGHLDRIVNVSNLALFEPEIVGETMQITATSTVTTFRFLSEEERKRLIAEKKIKEGAK